MTRIVTSAAGIPLLIYLIKFAPDFVFSGVVLGSMLIALHEYFEMAGSEVTLPLRLTGFLFALVAVLFSSYLGLAPVAVLCVALLARMNLKQAFSGSALTILGIFYVGMLMGYLLLIRRLEGGADLLMMLFVIIWANDIFAYLFGRTFGKHKLAPVVSPKKTVEGAIAGFVFGVLGSVLYCHFFVGQLTLIQGAAAGAVVGVLGQIGDLCESILKRAANVKDSGTILPGHGGMLDRIDSLLFGAPAMYYFYLLLHR